MLLDPRIVSLSASEPVPNFVSRTRNTRPEPFPDTEDEAG
ncbi:hypothetical protein LCGC14_2561890, partial [marine sediment metagenome]